MTTAELLRLAGQYVTKNPPLRALRYCPSCGKRARLADGAEHCARCVQGLIHRAIAELAPAAAQHERERANA